MSSKHHSHHHSSSKRSESKSTSRVRKVLSFFLFVSIFVLSVACCLKAVVLNPNEIAGKFTEKEYASSLYLDVQQYAYDMSDECSIPRSCVDDAITYTSIYDINEAYIIGNMCDDERFTSSTYTVKLNALNKALIKSVNQELKSQNISVKNNDCVKNFSQKIVDYVAKTVEIEYISKLQTVTNVGKVGIVALIVVSAIFALILILGILSISKKKYRCVRAISFSFISASMLDFIMVLGVEIVKKTKSLFIFPTYLCDAVMRYVEDSKNVFVGAGMAGLVVAIILMVTIWKLKRDDK